jgi:hypothetical protein
MAASRARPPFIAIPAATETQAGAGFIFNQDMIRGFCRLAKTRPAGTTGASFAVDGLF